MNEGATIQPEIAEEPRLPSSEAKMADQPNWEPRYEGSKRLGGKVAIIAGADSGIGRAVAALFARSECFVNRQIRKFLLRAL